MKGRKGSKVKAVANSNLKKSPSVVSGVSNPQSESPKKDNDP